MDADAEEGMDIEQWIGHIADLQAAHSSHVAGMVYGCVMQEQAGSMAHRWEMFWLSSTNWHQFLGFSALGHPSILGKCKRAPWEDEAEVSCMECRHQLAIMDLEAAAQCMMGRPAMWFWGVQDPAMRAIQWGESPVVAVMPMGGGKSILFIVPAFTAPGGTTIIVVLLIELGISCVLWESWRPPDAASIMLVTPESAVSPDFQMFLNWLRWTRRLDQIMIDECHVVLNSQRDFWPQMSQLGRMEAKLCWRMKYDQAAVTIYQAQTSQPNVAYWVWWPDMTGVGWGPYQWIKSKAVVAFIQDRIRRAAGGR
ncbi:uncharacterized protein P174DRAFT_426093 [Aspergillus novofumigatus IBT 16806]|uniref:Helicase ATP-binding domain-containing protein n=1 Tax=Aspergillus novofumigatus (strain IBT 16806) TaxID=1392255 RepID=A0A2I1BSK8_ASPN1|nr:uncharacterized protein P174DRAFT_426093 [Aspergillus novofumigatus IBT 16806]PKX88400.1 hypothetical protein P174DRAFT_426093 [Aspergillus novofumigatus IBT 16806]